MAHSSIKEVQRVHAERLKNLLQDRLEGREPTKFIVTRGDNKVCDKCLAAEGDGVIPFDRPYSNGLMHPSFHGKTCRCKEMTSGQLSQGLAVSKTGDIGYEESTTAEAAFKREFGSGVGPPEPTFRHALDTVDPEFLNPTFHDLGEFYKNVFLKKYFRR